MGWPSSSHIDKEVGQMAMTSALLFQRSGLVWSWSSSSHIEKEGGQVAMISALLFQRR